MSSRDRSRWKAAVRWAATGWLAWRILGPEVAPRYEQGQVRPLRIPGRSVFVGEREFFVRETGSPDATPLVLVHGWSLDGEMTFHRMIPALAETFRVIIPDHRNHGRSEWIRGSFDVVDVADELAGVLDAVGVTKATLFGWSMGGMVIQELARRRPDLVDRMILGATAAKPIPRHRTAARVVLWLGRTLARISRQEMATATSTVLLRTESLRPRHHRWMRTGLLRRDPTLYHETGSAVWRFDSTTWIGRVSTPALVIISTDDQLVPATAQRDLASRLQDVEVVELEGARHEAVLNRAEEIVDLVERFSA